MSAWTRLFGSNNSNGTAHVNGIDHQPLPDIPETTFIEKSTPVPEKTNLPEASIRQDNIQALYDFLSKDYQQQGYEDALVNPDTSYMKQNIEAIFGDLEILIRRVITFYEDTLEELEFMIQSRGRLGMVDTVDELNMKKEKALRHIEKVKEMENEAREQLGSSQRMIISYKRGFSSGMAAISHHEINKRTF